MKVIYIAKFDKFYKTGNYVADAFNRQSVKVVKVPPDIGFVEVKTIINHEQPDFVLYGKVMRIQQLIPWLRSQGITSAFWLYDMAWGSSPVADANRDYILRMNMHQSDLFFSTDGGHEKEWASLGVNHITLRQGIHAPDHRWMPHVDVDFDILFTGHLYFSLRDKMITFLKKRYGKQFRHVTSGLRGVRLNEIVRSTKIVIADSYPSPRYWSNRVYEITGRGGFTLHSKVEGLADEFWPGRDIAVFTYGKGHDELEVVIDHYLECDEDRERIRTNGFDKCPTYDDRVIAMLGYVRQLTQKGKGNNV